MAAPQWSEESLFKREEARWNRAKDQYIERDPGKKEYGMNRTGFQQFPQMLYKAQPHPMSGKYEVGAPRDIVSPDKTTVIFDAEAFSRTCQLIVQNEQEYERAHSDGWKDSQKEAMDFHEGLQNDIARAAAERAYADRRMTEKARAEAEAAEKGTDQHVPEVPVKLTDPATAQRKRDALARAREAKAAKKAAAQEP